MTLFLNFVILVIAIVIIIFGAPIYLVTLIFCIIIAACNLFMLNSYNTKTKAAFYATILTTVILILAIYFSVSIGDIQGFTTEEQDETYIFSMNIGIDMVKFMVFTIVLAVIAAVIDLAITISSPICELNETNPELTQKELFHSGLRVGRDISNFSKHHLLSLFRWSTDIIFLVLQT